MAINWAFSIHNMSGLNLAMQVLGRYVHCINHFKIVRSWRQLCWLLALTKV
jgi:hypothetical protein